MADPHIKEELDSLDQLTVVLYRSGITLAGLTLLGAPILPHPVFLFLLALGVVLMASTLHIYDRKIRLLLQGSAWEGMLWLALPISWMLGYVELFDHLALASFYFLACGVALKEYYCFKVPLQPGLPVLLALHWFLSFFIAPSLVLSALQLAAGAVLLFLAFRKWQMPLHYDIGDRSKYQN